MGQHAERVAVDVAAALDVDPEQLSDDEDLTRRGLDSITMMGLASGWLAAGVDVSFSELVREPTLGAWRALVAARAGSGTRHHVEEPPGSEDTGPFSLTPVQYAYWVGRQDGQVLGGVSCHSYLELDGPALDPARLERAVRALTERHEMLRASFNAQGMQQVLPRSGWPGLRVHAPTGDAAAVRAHLDERRNALSHRRLAVEAGQVFDVQLTVLPDGTSRLHVNLDMLVVDVRSTQILFDDLAECYRTDQAIVPPVGYSFVRYLADRRRYGEKAREADREYWAERVPGLPGAPGLPLALDPARLGRPRFTHREHFVPAERWDALVVAGRRRSLTPSMVLLTAFAEVLARWSTDNRFLVNLPLFDRRMLHDAVPAMVADFTDLVLLEVDAGGTASFAERVESMQARFRRDAAHMEYSGVEVLRDVAKARGEQMAAPVVFASTLGMDGFVRENAQQVLGRLTWRASQTPQVWLDHQVVERDGGVVLDWYTVEELFPDGVVPAMFTAYTSLVDWFSGGTDDDRWSEPLPELLPADQGAARRAANDSGTPWPGQLLHAGFFERAAAAPSAPALLWGESGVATYAEVAERARRLAGALTGHGMTRGDRIGIALPKGPDQIVAVLGVLAAGGTYVPIGVNQPAARRARMCASADVRLVVVGPGEYTPGGDPGDWPDTVTSLHLADTAGRAPAPVWSDSSHDATGQTAYVVFTSGSTGAPKGVMVSHRAAWNTVAEVCARFGVTGDDRVLACSALDFDLSVFDVFGPLAAGGAVVIVGEEDRREAARWLGLMRDHEVTVWNSVPALLDMALVAAGVSTGTAGPDDVAAFRHLRTVLLSGDWIPVDIADRLRPLAPAARVVAMGGATEAAVWSNAYELTAVPPGWTSVPYGWPLRGQRFRVVDERGRDCPDWVAGELWIGGAGVAQGYIGDPERTADRFVTVTGERWYRTGDVGRYRPGGILEFLGRRDTQVKVGGHRIELGEVETAARAHPAVEQVAVVPVADNRRLAAAVVPSVAADGVEDLATAVRHHLAALVPDYMIPDRVLVLPVLPLADTGKVDRPALRRLLETRAPAVPGAPPRGELEREVARLWSELLGHPAPSRDDNFFMLGGDSLHATRLVNALRAVGVAGADIARLFATPVLADFAAGLWRAGAAERTVISPDPEHRYEPFAPTEVQRAYWVGRQPGMTLGGVSAHWYTEYDVVDLDVERLGRAIDALVRRHDMLRAVFDDSGQQRVLADVPAFRVDLCEVPNLTAAETLRTEMSHQVLDTSAWPLFDVRVRRAGRHSRVAFGFDNLVLDALSIDTFLRELFLLYEDPTSQLPPLDTTFREYRTQLRHPPEALTDANQYWSARLGELPPPPALPLAVAPVAVDRPHFARRRHVVDAERWRAVVTEARRQELTPSVVLAAAFAEVLAAWAAGDELVLNMTLFDRREVHPHIGRVLGDFTSLLLVACRPTGTTSWVTGARALQREVWTGLQHSEVTAVEVLRELTRARGVPVTAPVVFTSTLGMADDAPDATGGAFGEPGWGISQTPQVWLDHQVLERDGGVQLHWDAVSELLPDPLLDAMFGSYIRLIDWLVDRAGGAGWDAPVPVLVTADQVPTAAHVPAATQNPGTDRTGEAPRDGLERAVAELWSELLGCPVPGRGANFFFLGGDSLLATTLVRELHRRFGWVITMKEFFEAPTVLGCAALCARDEESADIEEGVL